MSDSLYKQIIEAAIFANDKPLSIKHLKEGVLFRFKLTSKQSFAQMSTRKHYPGKHSIRFRINGKDFQKLSFEVKA